MSTKRWTEADVRATKAKIAKSGQGTTRPPTKRSKYGNERVSRGTATGGSVSFDSRLEARRYDELVLMKAARRIKWFLRQVPFELPGGIRYLADFLIVWDAGLANGETITVEDCKGFMTDVARNKLKQVEEIYGLTVQIVTRAGL